MNSSIRREIGLKTRLYRKIKREEVHVVEQYNDLARKVKKDVRTTKRNYEVRIARDAQKDPIQIQIQIHLFPLGSGYYTT